MSVSFILSFNPEITWQELPDREGIILQFRDRRLTFKQPTPGMRLALEALKDCQGVTRMQLNNIVQQADGIVGLFNFNSYVKKTNGSGLDLLGN